MGQIQKFQEIENRKWYLCEIGVKLCELQTLQWQLSLSILYLTENTFTPQYAGEWKDQRVRDEYEAVVN